MDNVNVAQTNYNVHEFRIEQLFGSKTRARLLTLFLENGDRAFYVRELTRRIDAQLNSVRRELKNLVEIGIVIEVEGKIMASEASDEEPEVKGEKKKYYRVNQQFPLFDDLRAVMRKAAVLMNQEIVPALKKKGTISLVVLTGRFVDAPDISTDLFIVGTIDQEDLAIAVREFERDIAREVNYTIMAVDDFLYRTEIGDRFLLAIMSFKPVILWNSLVEI